MPRSRNCSARPGIRKTEDNFARELVTIDPVTGATTLVGSMGMHMADIVFARTSTPDATQPLRITSISRTGSTLTLTWTGGAGPFQIQKRANFSGGTWATDASAVISGNTATVTITGTEGYYRVQGQ
jgi:hypothetical protein